uniref:Uncharacterized protein n=1 Tax=Timema bartmani TaxID=61472 RepID=A0A7R9HXE2_9NEOP|nr:unnamed protein product [Timema bartmani]
MWRSNPALAGALLLLLLLLSPAAEAKRVPRRRPRPQAQQPETPGAGADDFNYEEGYDEYPDYYEELEFAHDRAIPTEMPPSVGEDSSNLREQRVSCGQHNESCC